MACERKERRHTTPDYQCQRGPKEPEHRRISSVGIVIDHHRRQGRPSAQRGKPENRIWPNTHELSISEKELLRFIEK